MEDVTTTPAAPPKYSPIVLVCKHDKRLTVPGPVVGKLTTIVDMLGDALTTATDTLLEVPCPQHSLEIMQEIVTYYETHHSNIHAYTRDENALTDADKTFCDYDNLIKCLPTAFWFHQEDLTYEDPDAPTMDVDPVPKPEINVQDPSEPEISPELRAKRLAMLAEDDDWADEQDTRYRCNLGHKRPLPAVGTELYVKFAPFENQNDEFPRKSFYHEIIPKKYGHMNPVLYRVVDPHTDNAGINKPDADEFYEALRKARFVVATPITPGEGPTYYLGKYGYAWSATQEEADLLPVCHSARRRILRLILSADYFNAHALFIVLGKCLALTTVALGEKFTPQMFRAMWCLFHDLKGDAHMQQWRWNDADSCLERIEDVADAPIPDPTIKEEQTGEEEEAVKPEPVSTSA
jgi:hypothetical protein